MRNVIFDVTDKTISEVAKQIKESHLDSMLVLAPMAGKCSVHAPAKTGKNKGYHRIKMEVWIPEGAIIGEMKVGKKREGYPQTLTLKEYKHLRSLNLSDSNIAKVFDTTEHFIRRFRDEHKIKKLKNKLKNNNAAKDKLAIEKIIIRERNRIKKLG